MSEHAAPAPKPADHPAFQLPAPLANLQLPLMGGGIALLLIGLGLAYQVPEEAGMPRFAMSSYLTAYLYALTIVLGCLFFVLIQHLVRAGWSIVVRRVAEFMMFMIVPMAFLFLPILFAVFRDGALFVWTDPNFASELGLSASMWDNKKMFLNAPFFAIRAVVYFAIWGGLALYYWRGSVNQDETGERAATDRMQYWAGPAVMALSLSMSFAAFDWGMSLAPMWFSTMFGVYIFAGGILAAHCIITLLTYILQRFGAMREEVTVEHYHDLGKYIFGFVVFWTYISFSQYMLIWYGNIPEETEWFYTRQEGGFGYLSLGLILFHWLIPFFGTMSRHMRRRPGVMAFWAAYILVLHFIDVYWIVMPEARVITTHTVPTFGGTFGVIATVFTAVGMISLVVGLVLRVAGGNRLVPVRDPRLRESIVFENI